MAVVNVPGYEPWVVARWAMRALIERASQSVSLDEDRQTLASAVALDGLHLDMLTSAQASRLGRALQMAADAIAQELASGAEARDRELAEKLRELSLWLTATAEGD